MYLSARRHCGACRAPSSRLLNTSTNCKSSAASASLTSLAMDYLWFSIAVTYTHYVNFCTLLTASTCTMDPLSVTMAIVGLLKAAQGISSGLGGLISTARDFPKELTHIKLSVDSIRAVLSQLQLMLLGRVKVDHRRTSLILIEQIVITLSGCVSTFSDVDIFVESLNSDQGLGLMDRARWVTKAGNYP